MKPNWPNIIGFVFALAILLLFGPDPKVRPAGTDWLAAVGETHQVREWEKAYGYDRADGWSMLWYSWHSDPPLSCVVIILAGALILVGMARCFIVFDKRYC